MKRLYTLLTVALAGPACSRSPASIEVEPAQPRLTIAKREVQLKATVKDSSGKALAAVKPQFASLTPTIATADPSGMVKAVSSGAATVSVSAGQVNHKVTVLVQLARRIEIDPTTPQLMLGVSRGFKATVRNDKDGAMIAGLVRWSSSDPEVFTVDAHGNVKTLSEGKATLTAYAAGISGTTEITVQHERLQDDGTLQ